MPDYRLGKIYMIWSPNTDQVYIGSTVQPLHKRFHEHKSRNTLTGIKYTTAREVLACGEARIELIEDHPCANKAELNRREGQVMREYPCVNRCIAGRTTAEYRADNKEHLATRKKEYQKKPGVREHRSAQQKEYLQKPEVREHIAAQRKDREQRPEVKARRAAQQREYRRRKKAEQQQTASA